MARVEDKALWAKSSGETITSHTEWCLKVANHLVANLPLPDDDKERVHHDLLLALALHDVGKAATGFQKAVQKEEKGWGGRRHEILSAAFASGIAGVPEEVILAIITHHRTLPSDGTIPDIGTLPFEQLPWPDDISGTWTEMAHQWEANLEPFRECWTEICQLLGRAEMQHHSSLQPLAIKKAWLNRGRGQLSQFTNFSPQQRYYAALIRGLVISADHLASAHKLPPAIPALKNYKITSYELRDFQRKLGELSGSTLLRAPTGSGKTEAALAWAQSNQRKLGRFFYVLPNIASINAMYLRLRKVFGENNVGILHSRSTETLYRLLEEEQKLSLNLDHQNAARTLSNLAHEIWFPIRVCTPHQILRYALKGKGWEPMLAEFSDSCIVFDEVHAYDPRIVGLTLGAAKLFTTWGARCLFMSATLPSFIESEIKNILGNVPTITPDRESASDRAIVDKKRHNLQIIDGTILDNLPNVVNQIRQATSTLVVCNHVSTSQEVYRQLKSLLKGERVLLAHSRFTSRDRERIEKDLILQPLPKVLVATQVVEVSLDINFSQGFIEPAPIDALIQRMGRINRYGISAPSPVTLFKEQVNRHHLYDQARVTDSIHELQELEGTSNPLSEGDLIVAADKVYHDGYRGKEREKYEEGLNHPDLTQFKDSIIAGTHQDWTEQVIDSADGSFEVIPSSLSKEYKEKAGANLWIEANALLVNIHEPILHSIRNKVDFRTDPWVAYCSYSSETGLHLDS
ncbi:MAG: CRISPR-associated helicase Cas3' [Thaumarchaeota archaeon]|nr:CRISPR-associated helicase Cas3' [Nitrososphaerota archaeon]MCL5319166.1 CRISPR-associated helicase Cas3' [Nitrososphaerota archaeon]